MNNYNKIALTSSFLYRCNMLIAGEHVMIGEIACMLCTCTVFRHEHCDIAYVFYMTGCRGEGEEYTHKRFLKYL